MTSRLGTGKSLTFFTVYAVSELRNETIFTFAIALQLLCFFLIHVFTVYITLFVHKVLLESIRE